ncbi:hypothetical protein GLOTRDRAFT_128129 [Gloeophyllum trabeum ATCC 11539]|uniref:Uncharacterized protein n=1 Tax=Gloeophyllum trabeum (strain ATCC 11539 / FP-39264 / Madison 617) TaxID=670483 RepID=S7RSW6_GLOTA|nr:uncharacterized protein GLOTRDRAFT_128129 [Gloeophyllum trabeum ATCC 11539]EPQ56179.1 hypothetical protein GLOTRDRAFT_128129 [Gloeophyllum trabeum ATCC 11539]
MSSPLVHHEPRTLSSPVVPQTRMGKGRAQTDPSMNATSTLARGLSWRRRGSVASNTSAKGKDKKVEEGAPSPRRVQRSQTVTVAELDRPHSPGCHVLPAFF